MPEKNKDLLLLAAAAGASSMLQVLFLRGLMAVGGGNELFLGVLLAALLAWLAAGSAIFKRFNRPSSPVPLQVAYAAACLLELAALRYIGVPLRLGVSVFGTALVPGETIPLVPAMTTALLIGAPSGVILGMLFPLVVSRSAERQGAVGTAYAWDAAGHVGGFLFITAGLVLGMKDTFFMILVPVVILAALPSRRWLKAVAICGGAAAALLLAGPLERLTGDRGGLLPGRPFETRNSPAREIALIGTPSEYSVYSGGGRVTCWPPSGIYPHIRLGVMAAGAGPGLMLTEDFGALKAALSPASVLPAEAEAGATLPRYSGGPSSWTAASPDMALRRLLEDAVFRAVPGHERHLYPVTASVSGDPFRTVRRIRPSSLSFVYADLPDVLSIAANRYYTAEFQETLSARLAGDGIAVEFFPVVSGGLAGVSKSLVCKVHSTLTAAFGEHVAFHADDGVIYFLSNGPGLRARLDTAAAKALVSDFDDLKAAGVWAGLERHDETRFFLEALPRSHVESIHHPAAFIERLRVEEAFHSSRPAASTGEDSRLPWVLAGVPLLAAVAAAAAGLVFGRPALFVSADAAATGLTGMGVEVVVLFAYQASRGMMYVFTALVIAAFMCGFHAGSRHAVSVERSSRRTGFAPWYPAAAAAAALVYVYALPGIAWLNEALVAAGMLLAGWACGMNLSLLPARDPSPTGAAAARIAAADSMGGAAGALLTALVLVPLLGLPGALIYIVALKMLTAVPLSFRPRQ
ncbi:MAG: hypothetical protein JW909_03795 [Planctomycetes bacterium]|nr:hypothetical protein [Planctomycetota bacterium]